MLADTPLWEIPYTDLREGTKYAVTILYELGKADDVINMEADGYTVFCAKNDNTLWYWDSGTVKYHDHTDAIADPETYLENYQGSTIPDKETTDIFQAMDLKTLAFEKLHYQKIVSINTDGLYSFTLVDEGGEWYEIDFSY